ncbi:MAG: phospholipase D-like domain-containing protein [Acidobacteria bacterium]|nr:phospholipase D-like domain-containing protein [Acidobacteriota bacterium]
MKPEEVAQRYAYSRADFDLIGYAEVGLPVYRLTILALTLRHKKVSPLEEFVLRSLSAGLINIGEVGAFLGIKRTVVESILVNLFRSEDVTLSGEPGTREQLLRLTQKGLKTIETALSVTPEERSLQVYFDGLLRTPISLPRELLYSPRELRDEGMIEIPALPVTPPQLKDISPKDFEKIIQQTSKRIGENRIDILALKDMEKRERFFRQGVALKYLSKDKQSLQVAFVIDGRISEDHEKAFAVKDGPRKSGHLFTTPILSEDISHIVSRDIADLPSLDQGDSERLKLSLVDALKELEQANSEFEDAETKEGKAAAELKRQEATNQITSSRKALEDLPMRFLSVYDHPPILEKAITDSQERVMIISPWIRQQVVDVDFVDKLRTLLNRDVRIYIGYGLGDNNSDEQAIRALRNLARQYSSLSIVNIGHTHAKVLISDRSYVVIGSFNWLSFRGDPNRTFRDEQGVLISHPTKVEEKFLEQFQLHFDKDK